MVKPVIRNLSASSAGIINNITASEAALAGAPLAKNTVDSIKMVGEWICATQQRQNAFLSALCNKIVKTVIETRAYTNPWKWAKRGSLEVGDSLELIFTSLVKAENVLEEGQSVNDKLADLFRTRTPNVLASYMSTNFAKKYSTTIDEETLSYAFSNTDGLLKLVGDITAALYTSFELDEFLMLKFVVYRCAIDGKIKAYGISALSSEANCKAAVEKIRSISNEMTFMKSKYNMAKVLTHTPKEAQKVIVDCDTEAKLGVQVLASAFNKSEVEYGERILVDSFGDDELERLHDLLGLGENESVFTSDEINLINTIKLIILDKDWLLMYDRLVRMTEQYTPNDLKTTLFLHHAALFAASPFRGAALLTTSTPAVTSIALTPATGTASVYAGGNIACTATVTATFENQDVVWSIVGTEGTDYKKGTYIGMDGVLHLAATENAENITVKCTSVADATVYATTVIANGSYVSGGGT